MLCYGYGRDLRELYGHGLGTVLSPFASRRELSQSEVQYLETSVKTIDESEPNRFLANALISGIRIRIAESHYKEGRYGECIDLARMALDNASIAGDERLIYDSLAMLGHSYRGAGEYDQAIRFFEKSLAYCRIHWPVHLIDSMSNLADTLVGCGDRWSQAMVVHEMIVEMCPYNLKHRVAYFQCLIRTGDRSGVRSASRAAESDDIERVVNSIASLVALRRYSQARTVASIGLDIARLSKNEKWIELFANAASLSNLDWKMHYMIVD